MISALNAVFAALAPSYWRELAAQALAVEGVDAAEVAADLAEAIDGAIDFAALLPAPWGALVEAFDGPIIARIVKAAIEPLETPEEREAFLRRLQAGIRERRTARRLARGAKPHRVSSLTPGQQ